MIDIENLGYILPSDTQLLSYNGKPLTGGHVEIYEAGTVVKYISYSDFDGTQNPFSITIPDDGRIVAIGDVWLKYDYYVYDSYHNLIFSRKNISPIGTGEYNVIINTDVQINDGDGIDVAEESLPGNVKTYTISVNDDIKNGLVTNDEKTTWNNKQDEIVDLDDIREKAYNAVQPDAIADMETKTHAAATYQPKGNYLTEETDPVFNASPAAGITSSDISNWNDAVAKKHTHSNKSELDKIATGDKAKWDAKQDAISDLGTIRSNAAHGNTAYSWGNHANAGYYKKPSSGIPKTDLASDVQSSLGKADSALQSHQSLDGYVNGITADSTTSFTDATTIVVGKSGKNIITRTTSALWTYIKSKADAVYSALGHKHTKSDITDFPSSIPADGGDAYRLYCKRNAMPDGTAITNLNNFYQLSKVMFGEFNGASVSNCPVNNAWVLVESRCGADSTIYVTQIATRMTGNMSGSTETTNNGDMWIRTCNGGIWTSWVKYVKPSDIPTSLPASDVYPWAKAENKPTYTASEVGAATSNHSHGAIDNGGHIWAANQVPIENGDRLVIIDATDNSSALMRSSITFDGVTKTSFLSRAGTFENTANAANMVRGTTTANNDDIHFRATTGGIVISSSETSGEYKPIFFRTGVTRDSSKTAVLDENAVYHGKINCESDSADTLVVKRTSSNGGSFVRYNPANQTANYWRVGADATGTQFAFAPQGTIKSYIDTDGVYHGNVEGNATTAGLATNSTRWNNYKLVVGTYTTATDTICFV